MSNMSYCRFQNTALDLQDCYDAMDEDLSDEETRSRKRIIELACDIAVDYGWEIDKNIVED